MSNGWIAVCQACGLHIGGGIASRATIEQTMEQHMVAAHSWPDPKRQVGECPLCKQPITAAQEAYDYHLTGHCHISCYELDKMDNKEDREPVEQGDTQAPTSIERL